MIATLIAALPMLLAFVWMEFRKTQLNRGPLVDLRLFGDKSFTAGLFVTVAFYTGTSAFFLVLSMFLQARPWRFLPGQTANTVLPCSAGLLVAALCSARLVRNFGMLAIQGGAAAMATAIVGLLYLVDARGSNLTPAALLPCMLLYGFGQGAFAPQLNAIVLATASSPRNAGSAVGVMTTLQQLACAGGFGIIGNVFNFALAQSQEPRAFAYAHALRSALSWNIALLLLTMATALFLRPAGGAGVSARAGTEARATPI